MSTDVARSTAEDPVIYTAFFILLLTPLVFPAYWPFDVNAILGCSAALIFACLLLYHEPIVHVPRKLLLAFAAVAVVQLAGLLLGSMAAPGSWGFQALEYTSVVLLLIMGASVSAASLKAWMKLFMAGALVWSLIGLYVWCGGTGGLPLAWGPIEFTQGTATKLAGAFNQGNIFASMIGMAWIFAHWLFLREKRLIGALSVLFFTVILFDTLSRGGWIAYTLALLLLLYAMAPSLRLIMLRLLPLWLAGVAIGMGLNAIHVQVQAHAHDLLYTVGKTVEATLAARVVIWATAITEFLHAPVVGVGWGQFGDAYWHSYPQAHQWVAEHFGLHGFNQFFWSAHNLWLHVLAEGGLVAFGLLLWATWKIVIKGMALVANRHSIRLPFALVSLGFLIQSLVNIAFTRPLPMLVWGFFTGIAFAPWLRRDSWKLYRFDIRRYAAVGMALVVIGWSSRAASQWFMAAWWLKHFDLQKSEQNIEGIARFAGERAGAVPLLWLGNNIGNKHEHLALLTWMLPYLRRDIYELPLPDTYQVYFYALVVSGKNAEACKIGTLIARLKFPSEKNSAIYREICEGKPMTKAYRFGH